jgi:hypothetical protein
MNQETYQDLENDMHSKLPFEKQVWLAEIFHYAWYSPEAYHEFNNLVLKWESIMGKPLLYNQNEKNESTNTGA